MALSLLATDPKELLRTEAKTSIKEFSLWVISFLTEQILPSSTCDMKLSVTSAWLHTGSNTLSNLDGHYSSIGRQTGDSESFGEPIP